MLLSISEYRELFLVAGPVGYDIHTLGAIPLDACAALNAVLAVGDIQAWSIRVATKGSSNAPIHFVI